MRPDPVRGGRGAFSAASLGPQPAAMVERMRILHVIANLAAETGGPAKACLDMARAMARRGHDVAIYATDFGRPTEARVAAGDVAIHYFAEHWPRRFYASMPLARALDGEAGTFEVMHLHALYLFHDWAGARAARRHDIPYILQPHGALDPYIYQRHRLRKTLVDRLFQDRVSGGAAALLYTTEDERLLARAAIESWPTYAQRVPGAVVPLGIDLADYALLPPRGQFRKLHASIGARPILLFLGRLHEKKGLDLIARAFGQCTRQGLDAILVVAGPDGGERPKLERRLAAEGVAGRTIFTGMVEGEDKLALLADADLFLLPSRSENFGLAVIEAMAAGLPVVVSDKVNLWREIDAAGAGRIVPAEDAGALVAAIIALLQNPTAMREMGERGRAAVARDFTWDRVGVALEALYAEIAARRTIRDGWRYAPAAVGTAA